MPYITMAEFKAVGEPFMQSCADSPDTFDEAERQAAQVIYSYIGGTIPDDAADAPASVKLPAAWIIQRILISNNSSLSPEKLALAKDNYDQAITLLERYQGNAPGKTITLGDIIPKYDF